MLKPERMIGRDGAGLMAATSAPDWGGRMINRSTPVPISPSLAPHSFRVHQTLDVMNQFHPQHQASARRPYFNEEDVMDQEEDPDIPFAEDVEFELEGLEWRLELDDKDPCQSERDRPSNPLARQIEQAGSRCTSAHPTPQSKELPQPKRHRFASGDFSHESVKGSETRRLFHEGSPDHRQPSSNGTSTSAHASQFVTFGGSPVPSHDRTNKALSSAPPSPCPAPQFAKHPTSATMVSPPISPSTTAFPRYYTGGPLMRVDTPKTSQCLPPVPPNSSMNGDHSTYQAGSPPVPMAWRGNIGSTPPSIFYARPTDVPRGGGVSPLREVIRNWGISS